jgi:hypothetical protein
VIPRICRMGLGMGLPLGTGEGRGRVGGPGPFGLKCYRPRSEALKKPESTSFDLTSSLVTTTGGSR